MSDTITDFKNPKSITLKIGVVYLDSYKNADDQGLIAKTREVLAKYNIKLDVFPENVHKSAFNTIYSNETIKDDKEIYTRVYKAAKEKLKQMGCPYAIPQPVVFGQKECGGYGIAPRVTGQLTPRLIMIQPGVVNADKMTLLHELGHVAGLEHDLTKGSPRNFMHEADADLARTVIYKYQVEALAKVSFAIG